MAEQFTILNKAPGPGYFLDGMTLGMGLDAITGETTTSALDSEFITKKVTSVNAQDNCSFRVLSDATELENTSALGSSGSLTFPAEGVNVGAKRAFDFTSSDKTNTSVILIIFDWERRGEAEQLSKGRLSDNALKDLARDKEGFRTRYGDYFIYQISYLAKFTAIWKCTAETTKQVKSFKEEISGSVSAKEMEVGGSFTTKLTQASEKHKVSIEVQYNVIGNAGNTRYDYGDINRTFNEFRNVATPVPNDVLFRHYSTVDPNVPATIKMAPETFQRLTDAFSDARYALFLNGVVPGTRTARLERRDVIDHTFKSIYTARSSFDQHPNALKDAVRDLQGLLKNLRLRLSRQDLVMEMRSLTYDDLKHQFRNENEDGQGTWIESRPGVREYALGRTGFNSLEIEKYGIVCQDMEPSARADYTFLKRQYGTIGFPGSTGVDGYLVGLVVQDIWGDGTNGTWCLGRDFSLGKKQAKIDVRSPSSRGFHWRCKAYYIPSAEYDN